MRLNLKQEQALDTAINILKKAVSTGVETDEDGSVSQALNELSNMLYSSQSQRVYDRSKTRNTKK